MTHHSIAKEWRKKNVCGSRVEDKFSFQREFCYWAQAVVNFPASLSLHPNSLKPSPSHPHCSGQASWNPQLALVQWTPFGPDVLLTALAPGMCVQENAAWLTTWFGNMLLALFYAFYQVFFNFAPAWDHEGHSFRRLKLNNNFTSENIQPGPPSSRLPDAGQYSWGLEIASRSSGWAAAISRVWGWVI